MVGFFAAVTKIVPPETIRTAVKESVPPGTEDLNMKAFDAGYNYYVETYGNKDTAAAATPAAADVSA
jgi:2-oxoglutarate ferredoxin oxidoreductase subunit gamma